MNATENIHHPTSVEVSAELVEATGGGLRVAEVGLALLGGLLVCPPLLVLAVVVAVPLMAIAAVVAAIVGVFAAPILLVRHVRAHHRAHGSTLLLHRLVP